MKELYKIEGMTCNHCLMTVKKTFEGKGILASPNLEDRTVEVNSSLSEADWKQIHDLLAEEGYELGEKV
ncbi:hypothetical protein LPTSP3_g38090 [Leptospira kobayashii]|uniref:HMA domain-containing protein n=1 Tax=Leptospira kobayashii TaxID=1917830 RepID=A0ABM7UNY3_9LEPT|nr:heavy-metal-associated domain-containing protein [Leptospira kobayashii]BDA80879.1 hypothetical protein LPTSP3_g38090 [Leptospira kobayashii]